MIFRKIFKTITGIEKETEFKIRKIKRKYKFMTLENILVLFVLVIFSFFISGGLSAIYTGTTGQLVMLGYSPSQTYTELVIYLIIHFAYIVSLYMVYNGLTRARIDISLVTIGVILLIVLIAVEWYIISFVRGVPI